MCAREKRALVVGSPIADQDVAQAEKDNLR